MKKTIRIFLTTLSSLAPFVAFAQVSDVATLYQFVAGTVNKLYVLLLSIALAVFLWGLGQFILSAGDEKRLASGKALMFWGVIAFLVLISLWAIVSLLVYGSLDLITDTPCFVDKNGVTVGGSSCRPS